MRQGSGVDKKICTPRNLGTRGAASPRSTCLRAPRLTCRSRRRWSKCRTRTCQSRRACNTAAEAKGDHATPAEDLAACLLGVVNGRDDQVLEVEAASDSSTLKHMTISGTRASRGRPSATTSSWPGVPVSEMMLPGQRVSCTDLSMFTVALMPFLISAPPSLSSPPSSVDSTTVSPRPSQ